MAGGWGNGKRSWQCQGGKAGGIVVNIIIVVIEKNILWAVKIAALPMLLPLNVPVYVRTPPTAKASIQGGRRKIPIIFPMLHPKKQPLKHTDTNDLCGGDGGDHTEEMRGGK